MTSLAIHGLRKELIQRAEILRDWFLASKTAGSYWSKIRQSAVNDLLNSLNGDVYLDLKACKIRVAEIEAIMNAEIYDQLLGRNKR